MPSPLSIATVQAFVLNANGTVALWNTRSVHDNKIVYSQLCMQVLQGGTGVGVSQCVGPDEQAKPASKDKDVPSQQWSFVSNSDGTVSFKQGELCVDNNYRVDV